MDYISEKSRTLNNITGVSGEYFVAGELSRRGWIATLTLKNTPNIDILATTPDGSRTINVQVKSRSMGNKQGWIMNKSIESELNGSNFYIVFVDLKELNEKPDYYIVPRKEFSKWVAEGHLQWLSTPGRSGQEHNDSPIRVLREIDLHFFDKYHNNWNI